MRLPKLSVVVFCSVCLLSIPAAAKKKSPAIVGFVGINPTTPAAQVQVVLRDKESGKPVSEDTTNIFGRFKFKNVQPGNYLLTCGKVSLPVTVIDKKVRIDIDLSAPDGVMNYAKEAAGANAGGAGAGDPGPSDPALVQQMAGYYYSYQGSTERKLMLCPDGRFFLNRESSYSNSSPDMSWGAASQSSGDGRWAISGRPSQGVLAFTYAGGGGDRFEYRMVDQGCIAFNGTTYCRQGPADCRR